MTATDIAAWVGAIAGLAALGWQVIVWSRSGHRVKVSSTNILPVHPNGTAGDWYVQVVATNIGRMPVTVHSWGIKLGDTGERAYQFGGLPSDSLLPYRLEPGSRAVFHVLSDEVRRLHHEKRIGFTAMRPFVSLATGTEIVSSKGVPLSN